MVAGHSLGEITALAAAGVVTDETAVTLAAWRGELMQAAAADLDGGMLAVVTDRREEFLSWFAAEASPGEVVVANDNAPGQLVLSGRRQLLDELASAHLPGRPRPPPAPGCGRTLARALDGSGPRRVRPARRADPLRRPPDSHPDERNRPGVVLPGRSVTGWSSPWALRSAGAR